MTTPIANIDNTTLLDLTPNLDVGDIADPALRLVYFQYLNAYIQSITTALNAFVADGAVGTVNLADLSVTSGKLADLAVQTGKIAELAVTTGKLAESSITLAKMADSSVGTAELIDLSVTNEKIADGVITADKFVSGALNNESENGLLITSLTDEVALLQQVITQGSIKPSYVEAIAGFSWNGRGVPAGILGYAGGNYYLGISGAVGDSYVTVLSGNIADAGASTEWTAVIQDDDGNWTPYYVTGTDGVNKVNIYPNLKTTITAGEIANVHDSTNGQHYTERGYKALAQHIYNSSPRYAERNKYLSKFRGTDTSGPWTKIGNPFLTYNNLQNILVGRIRVYTNATMEAHCYADGTTQGVQWDVDIAGKKGFFETFIGSLDGVTTIKAEFYLDDVLQETTTGLGYEVRRLTFNYTGATTAKIKIFIENCAVVTKIRISDSTWWVNEVDNPTKILPPYAKVVYLGDSWGLYHNEALPTELSRLLTADRGSTVSVINHSAGGHSSKWAKAWFEQYVIDEQPTHVIIEFFVNDRNSVNGTNIGTYVGPDGLTYDMNIATRDEWRQNIRDMCTEAIAHFIQPIVLCPCATDSESQTQGLAGYNVFLVDGVVE